MQMANRRLFRRRENREWIKRNAYAGVTLLALAGGAVAWAALVGAERPQSAHAPPDLVAEAPALTAQETLPVPANETAAIPAATPLPATTDARVPAAAVEMKPAQASPGPAARATGARREAGRATPRQWSVNAKLRALAPASRRGRWSLVARGRDHARLLLLVRATQRTQAAFTRTRVRAHDDPLDRAYRPNPDIATAPAKEPLPPQRIALSSATDDSAPAVAPAACTRLVRAFGATRRIPSDC